MTQPGRKTTITKTLETVVALFNYSGLPGTRHMQLSAIDKKMRMVQLDIEGDHLVGGARAVVTVRLELSPEDRDFSEANVNVSVSALNSPATTAFHFARWMEKISIFAKDLDEKLSIYSIVEDGQ